MRKLICVIPLFWAASLAIAQGDRFDIITQTHPNAATTVFLINQPNPAQKETLYHQITFQPGDKITIAAGGCVQTGGSGLTWKRYTNPLDDNGGHLYSGTIYIPIVIPEGASDFQRIGGWLEKPLQIPETLPPTISPGDLFLRLGYQDDDYSDNSYLKHDDGTQDQCKNFGNAFVVVTVVSGASTIPTTANGLPIVPLNAKPFDVVWDTNHEDMNALPLNPFWAAQVQSAVMNHNATPKLEDSPNFATVCGGSFSGGNDLNVVKLANTCTGQSPTTDISDSGLRGVFGYCDTGPFSGHLEWTYATFTGTLSWEGFSGTFGLEDHDFNFKLQPEANAGLSAGNSTALGLEMFPDESLDNFASPFWVSIDQKGRNGDASIHQLVDNKLAVVTGLLGVDGVHNGGQVEIHPVLSMAIETSSENVTGGVDETWEFFVSNTGIGGGCSTHLEHEWPGISSTPTENPFYFLTLPRRTDATDVQLSLQNVSGTPDVNPKFSPPRIFGNFVFLGFQLPRPTNNSHAGVDGEIKIHYVLPKGGAGAKSVPGPRVSAHADAEVEQGEWQDVLRRITDPAVKAALDKAFAGTSAASIPAVRHTVQLTPSSDLEVDKALASVTDARRQSLVKDSVIANPALKTQVEAIEQAIAKVPGIKPAPPPK